MSAHIEFIFVSHLISLQYRNFKCVYRRYAGLFFCFCTDVSDNELATLEAIHLFVEILDMFFENVCELDLVFNFYKVREIIIIIIAADCCVKTPMLYETV